MTDMLPAFTYVRPASLDEALAELNDDGAYLHAGGTDLLGCLRDGVFAAKKLVSMRELVDLKGIRETDDGGVHIGAMTTIAEIAMTPMLRKRYPALARAASETASPQLRNRGTLGGNLRQKPRCWYYRGEFDCLRKGGDQCYASGRQDQNHCIFGGDRCFIVHPSDTANALCAYGARAHVRGPKETKEIDLANFFIPPSKDPTRETVLAEDEALTGVTLPPVEEGAVAAFRKVRGRRSWDFALASLAAVMSFEGRTMKSGVSYLGGAAPVPWRSREIEERLVGEELNEESLAEAAGAAVKKARLLRRNVYKVRLFKGLITDELTKVLNTLKENEKQA